MGFTEATDVKYAYFVSGREVFTMLDRLRRERDSNIGPLFLVLKNKDRNSPIRGVLDDVKGVEYRMKPVGLIDRT